MTVAEVRGGAEEWRLTAAARLSEVPRVQESVGAILRGRGVPSRVIDDCLLIVEEVVANVVTHAYGEDPRQQLELVVRVAAEGQVRLRFADDGPAFDPLGHPPPDLEAPLDERPVGGLGVWLVRQLAARCDYARENGQNVLTITCRPDRDAEEERG